MTDTAPPPRPTDKPKDIGVRLLSLLAMVGLFSVTGFIVAATFSTAIASAERPIWEQALKSRTLEATGIVLGAVLGAMLYYGRFRR